MTRRDFVSGSMKAGVLASLSAPLVSTRAQDVYARLATFGHLSPAESARDETFWEQVRQAYQLPDEYLYLNNGGASPSTVDAQHNREELSEDVRKAPSIVLWREQFRQRELLRKELAELLECDPEHLALVRNTTEGLATVIQGLDLPPGSEILTTTDDYPTVLHTLHLFARRRGWIINQVTLSRPLGSANDMTDLIAEACTPQTRLLMICDTLFRTGERLPIQQICQRLSRQDLLIAVDAAHTVGQFPVNPETLGCDFFASSLHKWMSAPISTGMLWIHPDRIESLWPITGYVEGQDNDIRKFEHRGTRPFAIELGARSAIRFHQFIGSERKLARLQYLTKYWWEKVKDIPGMGLRTNLDDDELYGAIASFTAPQKGELRLDRWLFKHHNIVIGFMGDEREDLFRISPHVYIRPLDLDRLVNGIREYYG